MPVHHVDVDHACARRENVVDLLAEAREIGGKDRRGDPARCEQVPGAHIGFSIEWRQCWQTMSSERLMRTIVWCSPQSGHWETSS
jgi:hypothetical protein